jgi:hypothetical protein
VAAKGHFTKAACGCRPSSIGRTSDPSPHEDILINVEAFRGAIRKGNWKLVKIASLPGKTELFDLSKDPGEQNNVADPFPEIAADLEARLIAYAKEMTPSEWIEAQPAFLGAQGKTVSIRTSTSTMTDCHTRNP